MTEAAQGGTATLDAFFKTAGGSLTDAVTSPLVSIRDRDGSLVVTNATPTHIGLGHFEYQYAVPALADLGTWSAEWSGVVDGATLERTDAFEVVAAGSITFAPVGGATCTPWATSADARSPCNDYGVDVAELDLCMQFATDVLFEFTGRKYRGRCVDEIYPNARYRSVDLRGWWPVVGGDSWRWGFCSCHRTDEYGCNAIPQIRLPGFPVHAEGIEVTIAGELFTGWELRDRRKLVRTDGEGWPCCQPLPLDADAPGGWKIRYPYGVGPPAAGVRCAAVLGCNLYAAFNPGQGRPCALPERVRTITRSGVTIAVLDPLDLFAKGQTGIAAVDAWIESENRASRARNNAVIVPGRRRGATRLR